MTSLRIVHCLRAPVGGLFRHVRDLAREQARRGHAVGLICDAGAEDALTETRLGELAPDLALGIARLAMPREVGPGDLAAIGETRRVAQAVRANILHGHGAKGGAYARLTANALVRRGITVSTFYTPHGGSLHYDPSSVKGRLFMAAERYLAKTTSGIIFESAYACETYARKAGIPSCPVKIIHNGITREELAPVPPRPDASDFVFVGELRTLKGVDLLLRAAARIASDRPCSVTIVGAGPDAQAFKAMARDLDIETRVTFTGALPAREAFSLGRALVMPSRAESLPYVALEAAGAGLPIIATRVGGIPEIVAGTDTMLIEPDNVEALASAMHEVLDNGNVAHDRAQRLRQAIAERFSIDVMTDGVLDFYHQAGRGQRAEAGRPAVHRAA
jgi:glycosyltransferase involved in cell wall biosynthesis